MSNECDYSIIDMSDEARYKYTDPHNDAKTHCYMPVAGDWYYMQEVKDHPTCEWDKVGLNHGYLKYLHLAIYEHNMGEMPMIKRLIMRWLGFDKMYCGVLDSLVQSNLCESAINDCHVEVGKARDKASQAMSRIECLEQDKETTQEDRDFDLLDRTVDYLKDEVEELTSNVILQSILRHSRSTL